jgi:hypothetical protein
MAHDARHAARTDALHERRLADEGLADEELVKVPAQDQLAVDTRRPVPHKQLSRRANAALWALRIFVIVVGAMVIYTFFSQLVS